jgi:hypothetical protein
MKRLSFFGSFRKQTIIIAIFCLMLVSGALINFHVNKSELNYLNCRSNIEIVNDHTIFRGVFDYKSGAGKGIANISGSVHVEDEIADSIHSEAHEEYLVQRTVLFTQLDYGISPIWNSSKVIASDIENVPDKLLAKLFPWFYLVPDKVMDSDAIPLSKDSWLLTKSSIPFMYCKKYSFKN